MTKICTDLSPRHYEDLEPGLTFKSPGLTVTEDSIIRFAWEWDFQPIHADKEAAANAFFGGLTASGLQTLLITMRLCNGVWLGVSVGLGLEQVRFMRPLRPGMTVTVFARIADCRLSQSRREYGVVRWEIESRDQTGETLLSVNVTNLMLRRSAPA